MKGCAVHITLSCQSKVNIYAISGLPLTEFNILIYSYVNISALSPSPKPHTCGAQDLRKLYKHQYFTKFFFDATQSQACLCRAIASACKQFVDAKSTRRTIDIFTQRKFSQFSIFVCIATKIGLVLSMRHHFVYVITVYRIHVGSLFQRNHCCVFVTAYALRILREM